MTSPLLLPVSLHGELRRRRGLSLCDMTCHHTGCQSAPHRYRTPSLLLHDSSSSSRPDAVTPQTCHRLLQREWQQPNRDVREPEVDGDGDAHERELRHHPRPYALDGGAARGPLQQRPVGDTYELAVGVVRERRAPNGAGRL